MEIIARLNITFTIDVKYKKKYSGTLRLGMIVSTTTL